MLTLLDIIKKTSEFFAAKGVESPRLNAELLIGGTLGLKRMQLYLQFERPLSEEELDRIRPLVRRRAQREPLQYILGSVEFCAMTLKVDKRALIPRPETEGLVEAVAQRLTAAPQRILDLGTGTGALALALAKAYPESRVTAIDTSADALALAQENAQANGLAERVRCVRSAWFEALGAEETFDVIVSNPPYLTQAEVDEAEPEVRDHEPRSALVAKDDGLADLNSLLEGALGRLSPGSFIALETGITHHPRLQARAHDLGYARTESLKDLSGRDRYLIAWKG